MHINKKTLLHILFVSVIAICFGFFSNLGSRPFEIFPTCGIGSFLLGSSSIQARALELEEEELTGERPELPSMITVKSTESDYIIQLKKSFIYKIEESLQNAPF